MRAMKAAREARSCEHIVCTIALEAYDPRNLWDVAEVRHLCERLVSSGLVTYLDRSGFYHQQETWAGRHNWGSLIVWLCSKDKMPHEIYSDPDLAPRWRHAMLLARDRAHAALGPTVGWDGFPNFG